jgi:IS5 family transposase
MAVKTKLDGWADYEVSCRKKRKLSFLDNVLLLIEWTRIERIIRKKYKKFFNAVGSPAYPSLTMFKIMLLQTWYDLSDPQTEEALLDRISFARFVGLSLASDVPDHSTICRFRNELLELGLYEKLFNEINKQLEEKGILVRKGAIVDATVIESSRRPRKVVETERIPEDRKEEDDKDDNDGNAPEIHYSEDTDAKWLKKGNKSIYGFKAHLAVDTERGLILAGHVTSANISDMHQLDQVVEECNLPKGAEVLTGKGYACESNRKILDNRKLKDKIMKKAARNRALTEEEKKWNNEISKIRYKVEQTIGLLKKNLGFTRMRYLGTGKRRDGILFESNGIKPKKIRAFICFIGRIAPKIPFSAGKS